MRISNEKLREVLRKHEEWVEAGMLANDDRRASLADINLEGANLAGANLIDAYLRGAKLMGARLSGAVGLSDKIKSRPDANGVYR